MTSSKAAIPTPTSPLIRRVLSNGPTNPPSPHSEGGIKTPKANNVELEGAHQLIPELDHLNVRSPVTGLDELPTQQSQTTQSTTQPEVQILQFPPQQALHNSQPFSGSQPSPSYPAMNPTFDTDMFPTYEENDMARAIATAQVVAQADEAIKQLNGTSNVVQAPLALDYTLPGTFANFHQPQARSEFRLAPEHSVSRQSSTSSTTTEASTSSEESDLCIPSVEWVNTQYPTYSQPPPRTIKSPARMAPPSSTRRPSVPAPTISALPIGVNESALDDDDDDATVGHRERSPSTSSLSAQSGLDLLLKAVAHNHGEEPDRSKGKRKAGQEVVAQWRNSGTPAGSSSGLGIGGSNNMQPLDPNDPPPRKRRKSQVVDDDDHLIDPSLRDEYADGSAEDFSDVEDDGAASGSADDSEYHAAARRGGGARGRGRRVGRGGTAGTGTGAGRQRAAGTTGAKIQKKGRKVGSPSGKARRTSTDGSGQGIQCDYVNPLPVSSRVSLYVPLQPSCLSSILYPLHCYRYQFLDSHTILLRAPSYRNYVVEIENEMADG